MMNCQEARSRWNLYHDSEGSPELYLEINQHLDRCGECAAWYRAQERLEEELTRRIATGTESAEMWERILLPIGTSTVPAAAGRRLMSLILTIAACTMLAAGLLLMRPRSDKPESRDLVDLTSKVHADLAGGKRPVEFASRSDLAVEDYLRKRVTFPVRCPPRRDSGFLVSGAGVCRVSGRKAAYLVGNVDGDPVSIFILSDKDLRRFPRQQAALRNASTIECQGDSFRTSIGAIDRNVVLVIGRASCDRLKRVLKAYGTYPHNGG